MKSPPDNTIRRIEQLEARLDIDYDPNANSRENFADMSFKSTGGENNKSLDLFKRVAALEKGSADHEKRIADLENNLKDL